jgi:hypothetical protein
LCGVLFRGAAAFNPALPFKTRPFLEAILLQLFAPALIVGLRRVAQINPTIKLRGETD